MTLELSQELVSVLVIVLVCAFLSCFCLLIWFVRCRRDQQRNREEKDDRERQLNTYHDNANKKVKKSTPFSQRKIQETQKDPPKRQDSSEKAEKLEKERRNSKKDKNGKSGQQPRPDETIEQFETRIREQNAPLSSIREIDTPIRNKRLDTVSITAATGSTETLQRNDSKVNVFPVERVEEMDMNPGLNSPINLETI